MNIFFLIGIALTLPMAMILLILLLYVIFEHPDIVIIILIIIGALIGIEMICYNLPNEHHNLVSHKTHLNAF